MNATSFDLSALATTMPARLLSNSPPPYSSPSSSATATPPATVLSPSPPPSDAASTPPSSVRPASPTPPLARPPTPPPDRVRQATVRNRRLHYLEKHSSTYFSSPDLELADPLLYDRLIRHFQSAEEREVAGRERGWSGVLEADLNRAEAKIAARANSDTTLESRAENEFGEEVSSREEGEEMWRRAMTWRFLRGEDGEVDYKTIDECEDYDDHRLIDREKEEEYFDAETPSSVSGDTGILDY